MMKLGKIEKGSIYSDAEGESLRQRQFSTKYPRAPPFGDVTHAGDLEQKNVQHDILIKLRCKWGKHKANEHYKVLVILQSTITSGMLPWRK